MHLYSIVILFAAAIVVVVAVVGISAGLSLVLVLRQIRRETQKLFG